MTWKSSILRECDTCWRIEAATKVALLADGWAYLPAMRAAMERAEHSILLVGWDFDARVPFGPPTAEDRHAEPFCDLMARLLAHNPSLTVHILIWEMAIGYSIQRRDSPRHAARWLPRDRLEYRLDGRHPVGASHHQKILVVDDTVAFCGGSDFTRNRWDTSLHLPADSRRRTLDGSIYKPRHEVMLAVAGPAAAALGELARRRWHRATGVQLPRPIPATPAWPKDLVSDMSDVRVGIARTEPADRRATAVREVEALYLAAIAAARHWIYLENQYVTSPVIADALAQRLGERDGPEIIIVCPGRSVGTFERFVMDRPRIPLIHSLRSRDVNQRLRVFAPMAAIDLPITVHSKLMVVDDRLLRVGSANLNNRSLGLDTECDVAIEAGADDLAARQRILALLSRLVGEHVGSPAEVFAAVLERSGSLIATITLLNQVEGRHLEPFPAPRPGWLDRWLGRTHFFDPFDTADNWRPWRRLQGRRR
ncbi:phospholipase D-like domain-containing protein [Aurantimonas sp. C2-5-R2]|uniref:phospholipase D-like domain-containing protein n=1 Tax=unclassified Aurantimonas TaxID=2638230 RepID=UPI002E196C61|nr:MULTISPECIES: phospholipase D-like domain-containing protein [unclassified Aurantimonas]MEC5292934.1 phospholipase D-like domain-containing protein [Aurantimonas sp. C2-3-R2]MEC5413968.1 phospholipase D-like domain-containing protein [Aurantimonas sp. C2-4-R8]